MIRLALVTLLAAFLACDAGASPLQLTVRRIDSFSFGGDKAGGPLEFLGGIDVSSDDRNFGGLSGLDILEGDTVFMLGDSGSVVRARLVHDNGRLTGLADAEIDSLFPDGDMSKQVTDAEDVAFDPGDRTRGVLVRERQANAMLTFRLEGGRPAHFEPKVVGAPNTLLRSNAGLESVIYGPTGSPLAGEIIAIAEHPLPGETDFRAWVAGVGEFRIARHDEFDVSSARFLPDGDLMLLERRYSPGWGIGVRLRRIAGAADAIKAGVRLDGDILIDAGMTSQIDNMEGLAVSQDQAGRTVLTLVSDDNFSILQRTLILQFALSDD